MKRSTPWPDENRVIVAAVVDRVRQARKHAGLSQQQLADLARVDRSVLAHQEVGRKQDIGVSLAVRIASALGISTASLLGDDANVIRREGREEAARRLGILEGSDVWRLMTEDRETS